jgi:peptidoglycan hydrolase FlgJ
VSISPPSDLIVDVAKAADPQSYRAAVDKLARADAASGDYDLAAAAVAAAADAKSPAAATPPMNTPVTGASLPAASGPHPPTKAQKANAYSKLEAYFLQTFVEAMLPKDSEALFGSGVAGNIWKSMLAEHLANELAQGTEFGIAKKLAENRAMRDKAKAPEEAKPSAATEPTGQDPAGGYMASLQKLLAADGQQAVSAAPAPDPAAPVSKG